MSKDSVPVLTEGQHIKFVDFVMDYNRSIGASPTAIITPPRGEPMPQTREYWEKRAQDDQVVILQQKVEISRLKQKVHSLQQQVVRHRAWKERVSF